MPRSIQSQLRGTEEIKFTKSTRTLCFITEKGKAALIMYFDLQRFFD